MGGRVESGRVAHVSVGRALRVDEVVQLQLELLARPLQFVEVVAALLKLPGQRQDSSLLFAPLALGCVPLGCQPLGHRLLLGQQLVKLSLLLLKL